MIEMWVLGAGFCFWAGAGFVCFLGENRKRVQKNG